jgi:hypothetical protein
MLVAARDEPPFVGRSGPEQYRRNPVATDDRMIPPPAQRTMAERAGRPFAPRPISAALAGKACCVLSAAPASPRARSGSPGATGEV